MSESPKKSYSTFDQYKPI